MADLDAALVTVAASFVLAVVSYLLNGWRERSFERRKTNYHSKLAAFQQINTASQGLSSAYLYLRWLSSVDWEKEDTDTALAQAVMFVALAREEEAPLGSGVSQGLATEFEKIGSKSGERRQRAAAEKWMEGATLSLVILWVRLLTYHLNRLAKAGADALLVAETPAVQNAIGKLVEHVSTQLKSVEEATGRRKPKLPDIESLRADLTPLLWTLQMAMRNELTLTMLSSWGRRWWIASLRRGVTRGPPNGTRIKHEK